MTVDFLGIGAGFLLLTVGFAYGLGRRSGRREGFAEGLRCAPLVLRRKALERGSCALCAAETADLDADHAEQEVLDKPDSAPV